MTFSERLVAIRKERGLTQKNVYEGINIKEQSYQRYEYGRVPTAAILIAIADYFNVSVDYLLCRTDNPEINK